jgi:hypothetical protein
MTHTTRETQLVREGDLVVSVEVELTHDDQNPWGPTFTPADVEKLVLAQRALRANDLEAAGKFGSLFRLSPLDHPHRRAS